jgi:NADH:ubiquinone oxidoreductase subunit 4 (subunit M)
MLIIAFYTTDLFIFYLAFEGLAVPTFFLIYIYGAEITKLRAAKFFLVYSFLSSTLLSIAIIELYTHFKTTSLNQLIIKIPLALSSNNVFTNDVPLLSYNRYIFIYLLLFLGFGIKVPLVPFHM